MICQRLRESREEKHLSQGDNYKRAGLLRFYILRVEIADPVPAVEGGRDLLMAFGQKVAAKRDGRKSEAA